GEVAENGEEAIAVVRRGEALRREAGGGGSRERIRSESGARVVLGAVDAVGVGGERVDAVESAEVDGEREQELGAAAAAPVAADGDRAFAPAPPRDRPRDPSAVLPALPRQRAADLRDLGCFAGHAVAKDRGRDAVTAEERRRGLQRLLGSGDHAVLDAREDLVAGLRGLGHLTARAALQEVDDVLRSLHRIARE